MGEKTEEQDSLQGRFLNRELSWLAFNERVLLEAINRKNPPLERLRFLEIATTNLDEFFMVRVAGLKHLVNNGIEAPDIAGLSPLQQLHQIHFKVRQLYTRRDRILKKSLLPQLKKQGIVVKGVGSLSQGERVYVNTFLHQHIIPKLKPLPLKPREKFPRVVGGILYFIVSLRDHQGKESQLLLVPFSPRLPQIIPLPGEGRSFVLTEQAMIQFLPALFPSERVQGIYPCRFTQDANFTMIPDLEGWPPKQMALALGNRAKGAVVRLEVTPQMDEQVLAFLKENLSLEDQDIYAVQGPLVWSFVKKLYRISGFSHLKYPSNLPKGIKGNQDLFQLIRERDLLLHHPYDSFQIVLALLQQGARDPQVTEIFQSLYRVSPRSPIIKALTEAASRGKRVTVLLELKARFDEAANVRWAKVLEEAGCQVFYSPWHLKAHCKIMQIFRWEQGQLRGYTHLGTGNYNEETAKVYTDMSYLTADEDFAQEGQRLLKMLTGQEPWGRLHHWSVAPQDLRSTFLSLIRREQAHCLEGREGLIMAKMNSLVDQEIIEALYAASQAGVKVQLIIRGICCLIPGLKGISEGIGVKSIVGRFLEHSRVFYFLNNGQEEVYLSSADWMPRNLDHRIELCFPIREQGQIQSLKALLALQWQDNVQAWELDAQGSYQKVSALKGQKRIDAQSIFISKGKTLK